MQDNIFRPAFGNRPKNLVGRESDLAMLESYLRTEPGSRERSVLILGQRGYGKTVLLLELAEMASNMGYIVASPTITAKDMLERILEKLYAESKALLSRKRPKVSGGNLSVLGFGAGIQFQDKNEERRSFSFRLLELCRQLSEKKSGVLILVDEVQAHNEELKQLIIAYQEAVGAGYDIAIAMAGLPQAISTTLNDKVLTFLNRATKMNVGPLNPRDITAYYVSAFNSLGVKIPQEDCKELAEKTQGSPYLMQLLGHYITQYCDESGKIEPTLYQLAVEESLSDFKNDICRTTLNALSERDIEFLQAMAEDDGASRVASVIERMGVSSAYVQLYKRRLMDAGVIEQPRRGELQFSLAYLRDYLRGDFVR